ncbi:MAG: baseplate J/gp47 family protein [Bacillota bacterium]
MLQLPNLNDQDARQILETAMYKLKNQRDTDWEDHNIHDPGVTILESFVVMKAQQQRRLDKIGLRSLGKFLKLLEIETERVQKATAKITLQAEQNTVLPKHTQLMAYGIHFETKEKMHISDNEIRFVKNTVDHITRPYANSTEETNRQVTLFEEPSSTKKMLGQTVENAFYIVFAKPFVDEVISFDFRLAVHNERNPIENRADFDSFCENEWAFFGEKDGVVGWHLLEVVRDDTYDFLFSGIVKLSLSGKTELTTLDDGTEGHFLRIVNKKYAYEEPPCLKKMIFNPCEVVQQRTLCHNVQFTYEEFMKDEMYFHSPLGDRSECDLYIRAEHGFLLATEMDVLYRFVEKDEVGRYRFGTAKRDELKEQFQNFTSDEVVFRFVIYDKEFYPYRFLGSGDGTANKEFVLRSSDKFCYNSFELMVKNPKAWEKWEKIETLDETKGETLVYLLNEEKRAIRFGDNLNGKAPSIGENNICITSFVTTVAEEGNLQKNTITQFVETEKFGNVNLIHYESARGGASAPSSEALLEKIRNVMSERHRAVTVLDYEKIALDTPSLSLGSVTVIPLYDKNVEGEAENTVTIVVEPYCFSTLKNTLEMYVKNVEKHLEKYRLLTTKISVITPTYVPLDLLGELRLTQQLAFRDRRYEEKISEIVEEYIYELQKERLGITIQSSQIHTRLETLPFVQHIKYLQVEVPGVGFHKNKFGDIKIPPNVRIYFRESQVILS